MSPSRCKHQPSGYHFLTSTVYLFASNLIAQDISVGFTRFLPAELQRVWAQGCEHQRAWSTGSTQSERWAWTQTRAKTQWGGKHQTSGNHVKPDHIGGFRQNQKNQHLAWGWGGSWDPQPTRWWWPPLDLDPSPHCSEPSPWTGRSGWAAGPGWSQSSPLGSSHWCALFHLQAKTDADHRILQLTQHGCINLNW